MLRFLFADWKKLQEKYPGHSREVKSQFFQINEIIFIFFLENNSSTKIVKRNIFIDKFKFYNTSKGQIHFYAKFYIFRLKFKKQ